MIQCDEKTCLHNFWESWLRDYYCGGGGTQLINRKCVRYKRDSKLEHEIQPTVEDGSALSCGCDSIPVDTGNGICCMKCGFLITHST